MYELSGKDENGVVKVIDRVPDYFAETHDAAYCQQFWPRYTNLKLTKIEVENAQ